MNLAYRSKLEQLGLTPAEAQIYLSVLHHGPLAATAIAKETGIARTGVYPTLSSLADKGLVEATLGNGSKFAAVAPDEALPSLIVREEHMLLERKCIADELAETLTPLAADTESATEGTVQVVRTPQVISDRLYRLQMEAEREVLMFVKAPILDARAGNPAQQKATQRGVRYRCLYEQAVLEDPRVKPYLQTWIAGGEEARVYEGELPYKLALSDTQVVLLTLVQRSGQSSALLVRHQPFAKSIGMLFDSLWQQAQPLIPESQIKARRSKSIPINTRHSARRVSPSKSPPTKTQGIKISGDGVHSRA